MRDFNHTINVLVKAYLNDTLQRCNCYACAVGNMIADSLAIKFKKTESGYIEWDKEGITYPALNGWGSVFITNNEYQSFHESNYFGEAKRQIDSTGYSVYELARIEFAFESAPEGETNDEWMFNGLMAVVDVLAEIHGVSLEERQHAKELFVK